MLDLGCAGVGRTASTATLGKLGRVLSRSRWRELPAPLIGETRRADAPRRGFLRQLHAATSSDQIPEPVAHLKGIHVGEAAGDSRWLSSVPRVQLGEHPAPKGVA